MVIHSFAAALTLAFVPAASAGGVLFVDDDAAPGGDGRSWRSAYAFLQDALDEAADQGRGVVEIRVAQGTYRPDERERQPGGTGDRTVSFAIVDGVPLVGGFAGVTGRRPDARDVELYETILTGDLEGDDGDDGRCNRENSYRVVDASGVRATLDGFTVCCGNADGADPYDRGAGVLADGADLRVVDCTFELNRAGSGGAIDLARPVRYAVAGSIFDRNDAEEGGAIRIDGAWPINAGAVDGTIHGCVFTCNSGRAVFFESTSPSVTACRFEDNPEGGIRYPALDGTLVVSESEFIGNAAVGFGAAIGRSILFDDFDGDGDLDTDINLYRSSLVVSGCRFECNVGFRDVDNEFPSTPRGGAVGYSGNGDVTIVGSTFVGNVATATTFTLPYSAGGAIEVLGAGRTLIDGCTVIGNRADRGAGIHVRNNGTAEVVISNCVFSGNTRGPGSETDPLQGAGLFVQRDDDGDVRIANCTLAENETGIFLFGPQVALEPPALISNCVSWGNGPGGATTLQRQIESQLTSVVVDYSCVEGFDGSFDGTGTFALDPMLVDPAGPDGIAGTEDDDLRLDRNSPCIDAGDNTAVPRDVLDLDGDGDTDEPVPVDVLGMPRFHDDVNSPDTGVADPVYPDLPIVDVGAHEFPDISAPPGDACENAVLILSNPYEFITLGADTDGFDESLCVIENDVWFRTFALCDGTLTVSLSDLDFDAVVAVYQGLTCPDGPDQAIACFQSPQESVSLPVALGTAYRIRVGGVAGAVGQGTIVVDCAP